MKPPHAGDLKQILRFDRRAPGTNVGGVVRYSWEVLVDETCAKVMPTLGGEAVIAGRMAGKVSHDIWVRQSLDTLGLNSGDRAVNVRTGEIYNIGQPIDPFSTRAWLLIQAVSVGNNSESA